MKALLELGAIRVRVTVKGAGCGVGGGGGAGVGGGVGDDGGVGTAMCPLVTSSLLVFVYIPSTRA